VDYHAINGGINFLWEPDAGFSICEAGVLLYKNGGKIVRK
jgi:hypothetical protein